MNLLFAIKSLNVHGGGAERVLVDVAGGLQERGHSVTVLTFDRDSDGFYALHPGVRRIDLGVGPPGQPTPRGNLLRALPRIRRAVVATRPDLAVAFMHSMYVPFRLALLGSGIRVVASEHIGADHFRDRTFERLLVAATEPLFVAKTVPAAAIRDEFPPARRERVHVLANPVDLSAFRAGAGTQAMPGTILAVGRFMAQKNQLELIRAFARLAPRHPDWRLRIVGDGDLRPEIEALVAALGLGGLVQLAGSSRDMPGEYAHAAIVAVPSLYESFGLVTAEALASGRAVVGFAECPGTRDLVRDGSNGLLVSREGDPEANFAQALEELITNPAARDRLGRAGPASVARFEAAAVVDEWERFLARYGRAA